MHKTPVTFVVRLKAKKGTAERLEQAAIALIPLTKAEAGCLEYKFHASSQEADSFLFYENWVDQDSLNKHLKMPYLLEFKTLLDEILREPAEFTSWTMRG